MFLYLKGVLPQEGAASAMRGQTGSRECRRSVKDVPLREPRGTWHGGAAVNKESPGMEGQQREQSGT